MVLKPSTEAIRLIRDGEKWGEGWGGGGGITPLSLTLYWLSG